MSAIETFLSFEPPAMTISASANPLVKRVAPSAVVCWLGVKM
jgi:hypothetical protein